jgi:hypothetical protein
MALSVALPVFVPVGALGVFRRSLQEFQVVFENVFDPKKNVAESGAPHQRGESLSVIGDGGSHGLHKVIDLVQPGGNDGLAQSLEAAHVQSNVVVDQENSPRAVIVCVAMSASTRSKE